VLPIDFCIVPLYRLIVLYIDDIYRTRQQRYRARSLWRLESSIERS